MSWHFSLALVAGFSAAHCSAGEPSAPWKSMPTAPDDSCSDKMKGTFHHSPFGTMFVPSTDARGAAALASYRRAFLAKTLALPALATDSTASAADYGMNAGAFLAKWSPSSRCWKTAQHSLLADLEQSLEIWPRWGSMRNGECWERTAPAWTIAATECGLLPTPLATDYVGGTTAPRKDNGKLRLDQWRHFVKIKYGLTYPHPTHSEIRMGWPEGWSAPEPLATAKFQAWLHLHGEPSVSKAA